MTYFGQCSICDRVVTGTTNAEAAQSLLDHLIAKHPTHVGARHE